jgi:hypothetical protein
LLESTSMKIEVRLKSYKKGGEVAASQALILLKVCCNRYVGPFDVIYDNKEARRVHKFLPVYEQHRQLFWLRCKVRQVNLHGYGQLRGFN